MLEHTLLFERVPDDSGVLIVRHPSEDKPLLGVIYHQGEDRWLADMAGIGCRMFMTDSAAIAWCMGAFDGASGNDGDGLPTIIG